MSHTESDCNSGWFLRPKVKCRLIRHVIDPSLKVKVKFAKYAYYSLRLWCNALFWEKDSQSQLLVEVMIGCCTRCHIALQQWLSRNCKQCSFFIRWLLHNSSCAVDLPQSSTGSTVPCCDVTRCFVAHPCLPACLPVCVSCVCVCFVRQAIQLDFVPYSAFAAEIAAQFSSDWSEFPCHEGRWDFMAVFSYPQSETQR